MSDISKLQKEVQAAYFRYHQLPNVANKKAYMDKVEQVRSLVDTPKTMAPISEEERIIRDKKADRIRAKRVRTYAKFKAKKAKEGKTSSSRVTPEIKRRRFIKGDVHVLGAINEGASKGREAVAGLYKRAGHSPENIEAAKTLDLGIEKAKKRKLTKRRRVSNAKRGGKLGILMVGASITEGYRRGRSK